MSSSQRYSVLLRWFLLIAVLLLTLFSFLHIKNQFKAPCWRFNSLSFPLSFSLCFSFSFSLSVSLSVSLSLHLFFCSFIFFYHLFFSSFFPRFLFVVVVVVATTAAAPFFVFIFHSRWNKMSITRPALENIHQLPKRPEPRWTWKRIVSYCFFWFFLSANISAF